MDLKVFLDNGAICPTRTHKSDAGFDLFALDYGMLEHNDSLEINTGAHILIPEGYVGIIYPRSGLNMNFGITATGVIDAGYTGSIIVKLYRNDPGQRPYLVNVGDRIAQIIIHPIASVDNLKVINELPATDRGMDGFGSSGK